ncbi:glutamate 5-kinase [Thioclava sp. GXIMD4215]|uniref:glutamate 5-kinase n=1 Tax=Thioclava sp. GXIMD4215 TaxID=3131928 RepID=UPI0032495058
MAGAPSVSTAAQSPRLSQAKRVVIKIGSALLVDQAGLRAEWLQALAEDVAMLRGQGTDVVLVSSGSIALGRRILRLPQSDLPLEQSQAAAAVGQIRLAQGYQEMLAPHGVTTAQVLMTLDDTANRRRYLNSRATLETLLSLGVVPIVNENDTVATDEIRFGDNDRLAASIAVTIGADHLVLLSDVDGLYSANPKTDPTAEHFPVVPHITPEIEAMAGDPISGVSKGGMKTKLLAAKVAVAGGCAMAIMDGFVARPLLALEEGARASWFLPEGDPRVARKRWISGMKPQGQMHVDQGAVQALSHGKSLLPAGVTRVSGEFGRGEPVAILAPDGQIVAKGLVRYTSTEARAIAGHKSQEIAEILGYPGRAALIHRDDMVSLT